LNEQTAVEQDAVQTEQADEEGVAPSQRLLAHSVVEERPEDEDY